MHYQLHFYFLLFLQINMVSLAQRMGPSPFLFTHDLPFPEHVTQQYAPLVFLPRMAYAKIEVSRVKLWIIQ